MGARVVIGANFGDEGKGLVTDWLCAQGAGVVVRFNGGAQAGHTVETPEGRHVFHHLGSGTFCNVPTYLSQYFICNPILFLHELERLQASKCKGRILEVVPAHNGVQVKYTRDRGMRQFYTRSLKEFIQFYRAD